MLPNLGGGADVCLIGLVELIRIIKVKLLLTVTTMKNILQNVQVHAHNSNGNKKPYVFSQLTTT